MNVEWFIAERAMALALGFVAAMGYQRFRLWRIKRHAPSAKVATFHVSLTQQHYDGLKKKHDDVVYYIVPEQAPE